eukprot:TRINITY_DN3191_c0_g1_i3.p1 TRINITY_DN3191_c0_g1~~TRINITY_DN3191_c0_g1_i3.p1  ORF type:complete len:285 (+),score=71.33 TRINITY_DN3191_c0_g1_i3:72-926(+)
MNDVMSSQEDLKSYSMVEDDSSTLATSSTNNLSSSTDMIKEIGVNPSIRIGWHARGESLSERRQCLSIESSNHLITGDDVVRENALRVLRRGTCLFKLGSYSGIGHFRRFLLSADNSQIIWFSSKKSQANCTIPIDSITEIVYGQVTETFGRLGATALEDTSFSIVYANGSKCVNLIAKCQRIFNIWTKTLEHLVILSKTEALSELNELYVDLPEKNKVHPFSDFIGSSLWKPQRSTSTPSLKSLEIQLTKMEAVLKKLSDKVWRTRNFLFEYFDFEKLTCVLV